MCVFSDEIRNNLGSVEDIIHRANRRIDGIRRIIRIIITLLLILAILYLEFELIIFFSTAFVSYLQSKHMEQTRASSGRNRTAPVL